MRVAETIRVARRLARLSQRALAGATGMPQSTIARIESGANEARAATAEKLLAALGYELTIEPRLGGGVDRSLIRRMLSLSPAERVRYAAAAGEATRRLRTGAGSGR